MWDGEPVHSGWPAYRWGPGATFCVLGGPTGVRPCVRACVERGRRRFSMVFAVGRQVVLDGKGVADGAGCAWDGLWGWRFRRCGQGC